jgi:hypothetical protein
MAVFGSRHGRGGGFRLFTASTAADVVLGGCSQPFAIAFGDHAWIPWHDYP